MAHSYVTSVFHIVFSTNSACKQRPNQLGCGNYLAGIGRNHGMQVLAVAGMENHVHMLVVLPSDMALSDAVRTSKANSSRWVRETDRLFAWQRGYGAFSVSPSQLERGKRYIANQPQHHRLFGRAGVPGDVAGGRHLSRAGSRFRMIVPPLKGLRYESMSTHSFRCGLVSLALWAGDLGVALPTQEYLFSASPLISFEALFVVISQKLLIWNKSFGKLYTQPFIVQQQRSG